MLGTDLYLDLPPAGFFIAAGNASSICRKPMTLDTQMTLALLQEMLMALRANDVNNYEPLQTLGIENFDSGIVLENEPQ